MHSAMVKPVLCSYLFKIVTYGLTIATPSITRWCKCHKRPHAPFHITVRFVYVLSIRLLCTRHMTVCYVHVRSIRLRYTNKAIVLCASHVRMRTFRFERFVNENTFVLTRCHASHVRRAKDHDEEFTFTHTKAKSPVPCAHTR
jgi:hypothetical protein